MGGGGGCVLHFHSSRSLKVSVVGGSLKISMVGGGGGGGGGGVCLISMVLHIHYSQAGTFLWGGKPERCCSGGGGGRVSCTFILHKPELFCGGGKPERCCSGGGRGEGVLHIHSSQA